MNWARKHELGMKHDLQSCFLKDDETAGKKATVRNKEKINQNFFFFFTKDDCLFFFYHQRFHHQYPVMF
jgi:hypothetical protein